MLIVIAHTSLSFSVHPEVSISVSFIRFKSTSGQSGHETLASQGCDSTTNSIVRRRGRNCIVTIIYLSEENDGKRQYAFILHSSKIYIADNVDHKWRNEELCGHYNQVLFANLISRNIQRIPYFRGLDRTDIDIRIILFFDSITSTHRFTQKIVFAYGARSWLLVAIPSFFIRSSIVMSWASNSTSIHSHSLALKMCDALP